MPHSESWGDCRKGWPLIRKLWVRKMEPGMEDRKILLRELNQREQPKEMRPHWEALKIGN